MYLGYQNGCSLQLAKAASLPKASPFPFPLLLQLCSARKHQAQPAQRCPTMVCMMKTTEGKMLQQGGPISPQYLTPGLASPFPSPL